MKKRLIVMVSLIIILLVAIGAVSAQNINATDNGSSNTLGANVNGNNSVDDSTNGGSLGSSNQLTSSGIYVNGSVSTSGDGSKGSPFRTLIEAYNAAGNGDTIYVASGTYTGKYVNVDLDIKKEITLTSYGDGPAILDGEKSNHIFWVSASNVEISGITVINGKTSSDIGGAISWYSDNGKIYNCSFVNCDVGGIVKGAAISWQGSHGNVSHCSFINNSAYEGGAIYWFGNHGSVSECVFVNNTGQFGGAIWWGDYSPYGYGTNGSVSGCVFIGNDVWVDGVIYLNNPNTATTNNFKVNNNIFLNNTGHEIYFVNPDDTSNVDYNWFGNNATDYEKKPELCNVEASVWLFLNATANPNPVAIFSSSDITFKLSAYNKTSPDITHNYDNSLLMPVNLTVNITSGKVDKSIISLNETVRFTPSFLGKANVAASIVNAECTIELNCIEANPNLSVESQPITYGENAVINLYYNPNATGAVNITVNGSKFNKAYRNLKLNATFVIPDILPADTYDVCVSYSGDINFINVTVNTSLAVKKAPSALEVNGTAVYCGNDAILKYSTVNATGLNVSIVSHRGKQLAEGIDYNLTLSDSQIVIGGLTADSYFVNVTALTDANHLETSQSVSVEIYPFAVLEVEKTVSNTSVYCGDIITYTIAVKNNGPSNATNVRIRDNLSELVELINATLDGKTIDFRGEYTISSIEGGQSKVIVLTVKAVNSGTLENIVYVNGSEEGSRANASSPAVVIEENPITIIAPDVTKYYNGPESFAVTLTDSKSMPISNAHVEITISGITYNRTTDANGQVFLSLELNSGIYSVTTQCNDTEVVSTVTVKSTVIGSDLTKVYRNASQYEATFVDTAGNVLANHTAVVFNINGVFYTRYTNEKGVARLNINLNPGEYIITAKNPNSTEMYTNVVTVLPSIVNNHDLIKYYRNASQYVVTILDDVGKPVAGKIVTFNINGMLYNRTTNATGQAMLNINLNPGEYIITAEYNGLKASNMIKVLPVIETADLHMKYMDGSKFEAKILDGQGMHYPKQEVTFNINGIFYTRLTDDAGIARLNIRLMPGEYIITSSFNGLNAANKITISS